MMRVLVTGATGFIGGSLAHYLMAQGHRVRALVRRDSPSLAEAGIELLQGDVTDPESAQVAMQGIEVVFHLAAVRDVWGTPELIYRQVNVEGTQHLLDAAAKAGVGRFIYCSSVGVARYPGNLDADETLPFSVPMSQVFYHRTKAQAEQMALDYARTGRVPAVVVRPVITYGPDDEWGMVTRLVMMLAQGQFIPIGNGRNHVDLAYVDDLVTGMHQALERAAVGKVYILSGTSPIRMRVLIDKICALLGRPSPRIYIPAPIARTTGWGMETLYRLGGRLSLDLNGKQPLVTRDKVATLAVDRGFSHARARRELGYHPQVDYDEGLQRTLNWLRETGL
ncbi:MAG: NAD-dependent epimerase/dehydratase family protein [Chloroflexi bacterium]|nr:NAD-dependent epimerase/dehydratase family protein [Chloroflexota bacterium]